MVNGSSAVAITLVGANVHKSQVYTDTRLFCCPGPSTRLCKLHPYIWQFSFASTRGRTIAVVACAKNFAYVLMVYMTVTRLVGIALVLHNEVNDQPHLQD